MQSKKGRYPVVLLLAKTAKWKGRLKVTSRDGDSFAVEFDAVDPNADPSERYVFDRTFLTGSQIREWTGIDPAGLPP